MKLSIKCFAAGFFFLYMGIGTPSHSQDATTNVLRQFYFQSMLNPEGFDALHKANRRYIDRKVIQCLVRNVDKYYTPAKNIVNRCKRLRGVHEDVRRNCILRNSTAVVYLRLFDLLNVLKGSIKWINTFSGKRLITLKRSMNTVIPGYFKRLMHAQKDILVKVITCR